MLFAAEFSAGILTCKTSIFYVTIIMSKILRGGYIFAAWIGDHRPRHVHVFRDGRLLGKFNLELNVVLEGDLSRRVVRIIPALVKEGLL